VPKQEAAQKPAAPACFELASHRQASAQPIFRGFWFWEGEGVIEFRDGKYLLAEKATEIKQPQQR